MIAVIGAGPAGLASAAMLQRAGERVVMLERGEVGEAWTTRYDRLHLHTVRWLSCLPGHRMPRTFGKWPSRDRVIEYLQRYAERHALDVRTGVEVDRLDRGGAGWMLTTTEGPVEAERVVEDGAAVLADGTLVELDAVIAATGFRTGLEPLVGHLGVLNEQGEPLVHAGEEHRQAPGLHFVGYEVILGGTFRQVGIQARHLARAVAA